MKFKKQKVKKNIYDDINSLSGFDDLSEGLHPDLEAEFFKDESEEEEF